MSEYCVYLKMLKKSLKTKKLLRLLVIKKINYIFATSKDKKYDSNRSNNKSED